MIETDNKYEEQLLSCVIPAMDPSLPGFDDIGLPDETKNVLQECIALPLKRPELFAVGNLTKPVKGILLYGPPGTGKTMLAKAVCKESGAAFVSITSSAIASMWYGESEQYAKAVFTLANKLAPCVIFIDEIDAILGARSDHDHRADRAVKNEIMSAMDGIKGSNKRVVVLGATNRPFDLDEAILRRMPRRVLVDLPDEKARAQILNIVLKHEKLADDVDIDQIAAMTPHYSGSDLTNLCVAAAYRPIREVLSAETEESNANSPVRPIRMQDFVSAKEEVRPSVSDDQSSIQHLRQWEKSMNKGRRGSQLLHFYT